MTIATLQCLLLLAGAAPALALADEPAATWKSEMEHGRKAILARDYGGAAAAYHAALAGAEAAPGAESGVVDALRGCSDVARLQGQFAEAEAFLSRAVDQAGRLYGDASPMAAALLSELAGVQRSRAERKEALASLERAIRIRESQADTNPDELAKDVTAAALLQVALADGKRAKVTLTRALALWDAAAAPDSPQLLPVLDALAAIHRDNAEYGEAETFYRRALLIRESIFGADSSELLSTLDSLGYVYFGQKKLAEAEPAYRRLLALWEASVGPEHPMVALTLDKMAEFFAYQQRYEEAEALSSRALAIRANMHIASVNQTGRILLMQAKLVEAEDLYRNGITIGDLAHAQDEALDPLLRIYGKILRQRDRPVDADAVEKRAKDAVLQRGDREGRRPSPVKIP